MDLFILSLSTCEVQSVCDYLVNPTDTIDIHNNATGCMNQADLVIYDAWGREVMASRKIYPTRGNTTELLDISVLPLGVYTCLIRGLRCFTTGKFVKL